MRFLLHIAYLTDFSGYRADNEYDILDFNAAGFRFDVNCIIPKFLS